MPAPLQSLASSSDMTELASLPDDPVWQGVVYRLLITAAVAKSYPSARWRYTQIEMRGTTDG